MDLIQVNNLIGFILLNIFKNTEINLYTNHNMKFIEYIFPKGQWSIPRLAILFIIFAILDFIVIFYQF